jgi:hypothetical protein
MKTAICICVFVFSLAAFAGGDAEIPAIVRHAGVAVPYPLWVSEEAAIDERGGLRLELFQEGDAASLRRVMERNAGGECKAFLTQPALEHHNPAGTLDDVVRYSRVIVSGTVKATAQGFYHGTPGTLLALANTETLKMTVPAARDGRFYVFIPEAKIATRSGAICSTMRAALPSVPKPGDSILVFVYGSPGGEDANFAEVDAARHVLVQPHGEKRLLSNRLAAAIGDREQFQEVLRRVREHEARGHVPWRQ